MPTGDDDDDDSNMAYGESWDTSEQNCNKAEKTAPASSATNCG